MNKMGPLGWLPFVVIASLVFAINGEARPSGQTLPTQTANPAARHVEIQKRSWKGDFDGMLERRTIRVLAPYSRSLYFNDKGRERGIIADNVRDFERWINRKYTKKRGTRTISVVIYPTTRDMLLPEVAQGLGDIAVGNLTVTEERRKVVDFASPADQPGVRELVVTGPKSPAIATVDDLAGKAVHVRMASSYFESIKALNNRFAKERKPAIKIVLVPDALEDEDMLEMLNAGILEAIVVDDWKAKMWAQILPKIKVNEEAVAREGGRIGWAIRKGSPKLEAEILEFYESYLKKQGVVAIRMKQNMKRIRQIEDPTGAAGVKRFERMVALFEKYGRKYNFDPLMLTAQGYQESQLNQNARSRDGAIGVMQIMPETGKELNVGNIRNIEPNIHAGTKYMDQLMTNFFPDAKFDEVNRTLFAFASYNAGPGTISKMRKEAEKSGFDPDKWFNNVEIVTARKNGIETPTYVRNIYKYFVAYKLLEERGEATRKAREHVTPGAGK
jgi:membrane-bound lytic murein transglycosylase MltF